VRFLADEQFPHLCAVRLRALDLEIVEAASIPQLVGQDDVDVVLVYAKRRRLVLLSGDHMSDRDTRVRLNEHLRRTRRGRIVTVKNATAQHWSRTVGKILWHLREIEEFFTDDGHGIVTLGDLQNIRKDRPEDVPHWVRIPAEQGYEYIRKKEAKRRAPSNPALARQRSRLPTADAPLL
jgi:hypothetical protein